MRAIIKVLDAYKKFEKLGLKGNPFQERELTPKESHLFAGREKETEEIMSIVGEQKNIHIYGKKGIGKSSIINYLIKQVKKEKITAVKLDAPPTSKRQFYFAIIENLLEYNTPKEDENYDLHQYIKKIERYVKAPVPYPARVILDDIKHVYTQYFKQVDFPLIIFIDNFDKVFTQTGTIGIDYITALTNIMFDREYFVFVTAGLIGTIKEDYIDPIKKALDDRLEIKYALPDFELKDTIELIDKRLEDKRLPDTSGFSYSKRTIQAIHEYSQTPREIITICDRALRCALDGKKVTPKIIEQICTGLGFTHSQRVKATLGEKARSVHNKLLEIRRPISPTELSKLMNIGVTTICYNLGILKENGLVKKIGEGNRVKYILDSIEQGMPITAQQQRIQQDGKPFYIRSGLGVGVGSGVGFSKGTNQNSLLVNADPTTIVDPDPKQKQKQLESK